MDASAWLIKLRDLRNEPFEGVGAVGLAILCRQASGEQGKVRHVGVLYRDPPAGPGKVRLLHLPGHRRIVSTASPGQQYAWLAPDIPESLARVLANQCKRIAERYRSEGITYAFRYMGGQFADGVFKPNGELGLTCATFVLAVFASVGGTLLRVEEWPLRSDDNSRKKQLIAVVRASEHGEKDADHVAALEGPEEMSAPRYRPEEVAAAGTVEAKDLPLGYHEAASRGECIVLELERRAVDRR